MTSLETSNNSRTSEPPKLIGNHAVPRIGVQVGESVRVTSPRGTIVMPLQESAEVLRGTAWLPMNLGGSDVRELLDVTKDVIDLKIEKMS